MYDSENALSHRNPTYYSIGIRGGVEDTSLEAKAKDTKKFRGKGQGQTLSRPRTKDTDANVLRKRKKVFKIFLPAKKLFKNFFFRRFILEETKKKIFADFPRGFWRFPKKFQLFKNSAVLKPRTGQFSRT